MARTALAAGPGRNAATTDRDVFFVGERMGSPIMAHGSAGTGIRSAAPGKGGDERGFAFWQASERFLAECLVVRSGAPSVPAIHLASSPGEPLEVLDRWTIDSFDRHSIELRRLDPAHRRRVEVFVALLIEGDTVRCMRAASRAMDDLGDVQAVAEKLFAPAARMVGDRWCADECSFVTVTMVVSMMQRLLRRMASEIPPVVASDPRRAALLAPAPGDQHTFGLSIVEDAFRRAGWEVDCCGSAAEADMLRLVAANAYSVIGISISSERLLPRVSSTIGKLRMRSLNKSAIVIAGGSLAIEKPQAAIDVGFDFVAMTARSAVKLAESVLASRSETSHMQLAAE